MAYSKPILHVTTFMPSSKPIIRPLLRVRAHNCRDEENLVDPNLRILRERIELVKVREKLERHRRNEMGWNYYGFGQAKKSKFSKDLCMFIQLLVWATWTCGLTVISGSLCLTLISLLVHFNQ